MKATGEIQVIPIGAGVSVRELHGQGTNVEGELDDILAAVKAIHEVLHAEGTVRLATFVKIGTRTDKEPSLAGKLF
jgi:uncharacterized protein (TIGR00106 family)